MNGAHSSGGALTPRECEVLQLVADGKTNREVAETLALGIKTAETHRKHIMEKLKLHTVAELTKYAVKEGLTRL
jgi:DNA-binding NarL/FixJ family response regulator